MHYTLFYFPINYLTNILVNLITNLKIAFINMVTIMFFLVMFTNSKILITF